MARHKPVSSFDLVVASGASVSNIVDLQGYQAVRIITPAALTATYLVFLQGEADDTMVLSYDKAGALIVPPVLASRSLELGIDNFRSCRYFQIRTCSTNTGTAGNEAAARTFKLIVD